MLIRRKSSTDDEYHHQDLLGNFGVITGANGGVLWSNVYDAFVNAQYVANNARIAQPVVCYKAMSEPGLLTGSGGRGVVVPSRGFQVMGKKPAPAKMQACSAILPNFMCMSICTNATPYGAQFPEWCQGICEWLHFTGCDGLWAECTGMGDTPKGQSCMFIYLEMCNGR